MNKLKVSALASTLIIAQGVHAHSGGLNSAGCHRETSTGTTHCHNPFTPVETSSSGGKIGYLLVSTLALFGVARARK